MAISREQIGSRRQWVLLAVLLTALAAIIVVGWRGGGSVPAGQAGRAPDTQGRAQARGPARSPADELDVKLESLAAAREGPSDIQRNPFRMEARRAQPPPGPRTEPRPQPPADARPPAPSGPPAIPLKFTGIIESKRAGRIAALTDCKNVFQGREGDIIEGRYRIVRIGVESIVLEYVDSGVQQTIRLSGCG